MYFVQSLIISGHLRITHLMRYFMFVFRFPFQELSVKTKDLINNLTKLAVEPEGGGKARVTLEALKQRKLTAVVENFLFNLAAAEGLV